MGRGVGPDYVCRRWGDGVIYFRSTLPILLSCSAVFLEVEAGALATFPFFHIFFDTFVYSFRFLWLPLFIAHSFPPSYPSSTPTPNLHVPRRRLALASRLDNSPSSTKSSQLSTNIATSPCSVSVVVLSLLTFPSLQNHLTITIALLHVHTIYSWISSSISVLVRSVFHFISFVSSTSRILLHPLFFVCSPLNCVNLLWLISSLFLFDRVCFRHLVIPLGAGKISMYTLYTYV